MSRSRLTEHYRLFPWPNQTVDSILLHRGGRGSFLQSSLIWLYLCRFVSRRAPVGRPPTVLHNHSTQLSVAINTTRRVWIAQKIGNNCQFIVRVAFGSVKIKFTDSNVEREAVNTPLYFSAALSFTTCSLFLDRCVLFRYHVYNLHAIMLQEK